MLKDKIKNKILNIVTSRLDNIKRKQKDTSRITNGDME